MTCKFTNELKTGPIFYVSSSKPTTIYPLVKRALARQIPVANPAKMIMTGQQKIASVIFSFIVAAPGLLFVNSWKYNYLPIFHGGS